jgi:hypothetical protein
MTVFVPWLRRGAAFNTITWGAYLLLLHLLYLHLFHLGRLRLLGRDAGGGGSGGGGDRRGTSRRELRLRLMQLRLEIVHRAAHLLYLVRGLTHLRARDSERGQ